MAEVVVEAKVVVGAEVVAVQLVLKVQMKKKELLKSASLTMDSGQVLGVHTNLTITEGVVMNTSATSALKSQM